MQGRRGKKERKLREDDDYSWYWKKINGSPFFSPLLASHTRQIFAGGKVTSGHHSSSRLMGRESLAFVSPNRADPDAFLGVISKIL